MILTKKLAAYVAACNGSIKVGNNWIYFRSRNHFTIAEYYEGNTLIREWTVRDKYVPDRLLGRYCEAYVKYAPKWGDDYDEVVVTALDGIRVHQHLDKPTRMLPDYVLPDLI